MIIYSEWVLPRWATFFPSFLISVCLDIIPLLSFKVEVPWIIITRDCELLLLSVGTAELCERSSLEVIRNAAYSRPRSPGKTYGPLQNSFAGHSGQKTEMIMLNSGIIRYARDTYHHTNGKEKKARIARFHSRNMVILCAWSWQKWEEQETHA